MPRTKTPDLEKAKNVLMALSPDDAESVARALLDKAKQARSAVIVPSANDFTLVKH